MNFKLAAMMMFVVENNTFAHDNARVEFGRAIVCIGDSWREPAIGRAELVASRMFWQAGVVVDWHDSLRACRGVDSAILVNLSPYVIKPASPDALAQANVSDDVHIEVFLDRVDRFRPKIRPVVLAHVLVHEVTHILEDTPRHSETGVMKAFWSTDDYYEMRRRPLPFAPEDIELIHRGLTARARRSAARSLAIN